MEVTAEQIVEAMYGDNEFAKDILEEVPIEVNLNDKGIIVKIGGEEIRSEEFSLLDIIKEDSFSHSDWDDNTAVMRRTALNFWKRQLKLFGKAEKLIQENIAFFEKLV